MHGRGDAHYTLLIKSMERKNNGRNDCMSYDDENGDVVSWHRVTFGILSRMGSGTEA